MYKFISILSTFIRQFLLPNPYVNIIGNEIYADLFNIIIGGTILHCLSYILTGFGYIREIDDASSGSIGYLISYCYITALITALGYFITHVKVFVITFIVLYIISCIIIGLLFKRNRTF